ncbi:uncharacterized protein RHIMIDRAFT_235466 [Rhizopus microsporus ATCC 52813]|uniref:Uncharacterized protein n=1 Tax=Rhizopus microsporus ATCC 52813 TaxID=1340429 RepID=A0A2G4T126_RHIZD|nr:uncharacterized protein RHIMIDRAFT_235466 [Rhizopus microsporus ATCC 52813]PHZ14704.1 hypothetical protein RHIMIDRAFT_235466 [Rhizopus microsporus ATCC 52813]
MDEDGNECVQTQVDEKAHPLDNITGFNTHSELKPSEKPTKPKVVKVESSASTNKVYEKGLTAGKAAKLLNIPRRTAYSWYEKD